MVNGYEPIVCDIGASSIKIGHAGNLVPEQVIPTVVAVSRNGGSNILMGKEALSKRNRNDFSFVRPIDEYGIVRDWKALESLLEYSLESIGVEPKHCPRQKILITKAHAMKRSDVKRLLDLFFYKFRLGSVTMHEQAAMVLYTRGVETGLVVELGDTMATLTPVYQGFAIPKLNKSMAVGGRSITQCLLKLLRRRGYHMNTSSNHLETAREVKERSSYVALNPSAEERLARETTVLEKVIPIHDGTTVVIGQERFEATEILFQPKLWDSEQSGLADLIYETIQEAPIDCRMELYKNIILSGGSSLLPGIQERIEEDLIARYDKEHTTNSNMGSSRQWKFQVHAAETRRFAVFEGAALFADLIGNDRQFWVTTSEYEVDAGVQVLMDKCQVV